MKVLIEFDESTVALLSELYKLWNWTGTLEDFAASSAKIATMDRMLSLLPIARELHGEGFYNGTKTIGRMGDSSATSGNGEGLATTEET